MPQEGMTPVAGRPRAPNGPRVFLRGQMGEPVETTIARWGGRERAAAGGVTATRVLIVDDHALLADGLCLELSAVGFAPEAISGPTLDAILEYAGEWHPDVVLLDLQLGEGVGSGLHLVDRLTELGAAVVVLTGSNDSLLHAACVEAGAVGILMKTSSLASVCEMVGRAARGERLMPMPQREEMLDELSVSRRRDRGRDDLFGRMTPRERDVLWQLMQGRTAQEIATASFVSLATVRTQIRSILQKLGASTQLAAVALAYQWGWDHRPVAAHAVGE